MRTSRLIVDWESEVCLSITLSLDIDVILQDVLNSARSLTSASYGTLVLLDDSGKIEDFPSSGLTADGAEQLWALPDGTQLTARQ